MAATLNEKPLIGVTEVEINGDELGGKITLYVTEIIENLPLKGKGFKICLDGKEILSKIVKDWIVKTKQGDTRIMGEILF